MTALLVVLLIASGVCILVLRRRLQDARYWRDYWSRRHDEMARELGEALSLADDKGTESFQAKAHHHAERRQVETALTQFWPRLEVQTPEHGAAVAVLRAVYKSLPVPGAGVAKRDVTCPKCKHPFCAAPNRCDDPEHFFGGSGP